MGLREVREVNTVGSEHRGEKASLTKLGEAEEPQSRSWPCGCVPVAVQREGPSLAKWPL